MDITEEDLKAYVQALKDNTDALGRASDARRTNNQNDQAYKQSLKSQWQELGRDIDKVSNTLSNAAKTITGGAEEMVSEFKHIARGIAGGALVADLLSSGWNLTKTYRQLVDVGEDFGGSMAEMIKQSGAAGVPLGEFARMLERNSIAAKTLEKSTGGGTNALGLLAKSVRDSAMAQSMYGFSVQQLDDLTGDYAESMRMAGRSSNFNREAAAKEIGQLAQDITDFSAATGKSRQQILETLKEVTHTATFTAATAQMNEQQIAATRQAVAALSSLPNGKELSQQLIETLAAGGTIYTEFGQRAAEAGTPQLISIFDEMRAKILQNGKFDKKDAEASLKEFQKLVKDSGLSLYAYTVKNPAARQLYEMLAPLSEISFEQLGKQEESLNRWGKLTGFFLRLENQLNELGSWFAESFGDAIKDLEKNFEDGKQFFSSLKPVMQKLGTEFGNFIKDLLQPGHLQKLIDGLEAVASGLWTAATIIGSVAKLMMKAFDTVSGAFSFADKNLGGVFSLGIGGFIALVTTIAAVKFAMNALLAPIRMIISIVNAGRNLFHMPVTNNSGGRRGNTPHGGTHGEAAEPHAGGGRGGAVGRILSAGAGLFGGGDCCNNLLGALDHLRERIDFHGDRAHGLATEAAERARPVGAAGAAAAEAVVGATFAQRAGSWFARNLAKVPGGSAVAGGVASALEKTAPLLAKVGRLGAGLKGGLGGIGAMIAEEAVDKLMPDDTRGKETLKGALEGAGWGAFFGPVGAGVGALAGALLANASGIKEAILGKSDDKAKPATNADADKDKSDDKAKPATNADADKDKDKDKANNEEKPTELAKFIEQLAVQPGGQQAVNGLTAILSAGGGTGLTSKFGQDLVNSGHPELLAMYDKAGQELLAGKATSVDPAVLAAQTLKSGVAAPYTDGARSPEQIMADIAANARDMSQKSSQTSEDMIRQLIATNQLLMKLLDLNDKKIGLDAQAAKKQTDLQRRMIGNQEVQIAGGFE